MPNVNVKVLRFNLQESNTFFTWWFEGGKKHASTLLKGNLKHFLTIIFEACTIHSTYLII